MSDISEGLDLSKLDEMSPAEVDENLLAVWRWRGPTYELGANSLMLDYAPKFAKIHRWGSDYYGRPDQVNIILLGIQNLASYMMLGWEVGIFNQFNLQRRNGLTKHQIMEVVMFTQLYAGMRGLGHVYRAIGDSLPAFGEPTVPPAPFPAGWQADPDAFKSGLDLSTKEYTEQDGRRIKEWYERTIGYVPDSITFGLEVHPEFMKMNRAKWEIAIATLPKQVAPHVMIRLNMMSGNVEGLREAVLLGRAWGMSREHVIKGITGSAMYFTSFEGLHTAYRAAGEALRDWPA
jgi:hypothetical protein